MKLSAFLDEAKSWEGTPFRMGAQLKGVGVDCVSFLKGTLEGIGEPTVRPDPKWSGRWGYYDHALMVNQLKEMGWGEIEAKLENVEPGDVMVFTTGRHYLHCGILLERRPDGVVEVISSRLGVGVTRGTILESKWKERLTKVFRHNNLEK